MARRSIIAAVMLLSRLAIAAEMPTRDWAVHVFGDRAATATTQSTAGPTLLLKRQDHGQLELARSVIATPLKIGSTSFAHGLGSHADSEIACRFPAGSVKRFSAVAGIDNNSDTAGRNGSAVFAIEIAGKEVYNSGVKRGGEEGSAVDLAIGPDASEIVLKVTDAGDRRTSVKVWGAGPMPASTRYCLRSAAAAVPRTSTSPPTVAPLAGWRILVAGAVTST